MKPSLHLLVCCLASALLAGCVATPAYESGPRKKSAAAMAAEEQARAQAEAQAAAAAKAQAEIDARAARVGTLLDESNAAMVKSRSALDAGQTAEALTGIAEALRASEGAVATLLPSDSALASVRRQSDDVRKLAISLVQKLPAPPDAPEEARREVGFAMAALKQAQTEADLQESAAHFEKALLVAPWLAGGYFNLATVQEKLGDFDRASASLRFYLLAAPNAPDAKAVEGKLYELEFAANRQQSRLQWLGKWELTGPVKHRYVGYQANHTGPIYFWVFVKEAGRDGSVKANFLYDQDKIGPRVPEAAEAKYVFYPYPFAITSWYGPTADQWSGKWTKDQLVLEWAPSRPTTLDADVEVNYSGRGRLEITKQDNRYFATFTCAAHLNTHYRSANSTTECDDSYTGEIVRTATLKNPPKN